MTLTIPDVEQWNPGQLTTAAAAVGKLSTDLDQAVNKGYTDTQALRNDKKWSGGSADIAEGRMNTEKSRASGVSQALLDLQTALSQQVENLENAKKAVLAARDAALHPAQNDQAPGPFEVAAAGTVTATKRKEYWSGLGLRDDEVQQKQLEEDHKASEHQSAVVNALKQAELIAESASTAVNAAKTKVDTAFDNLGDPATGAKAAPAPTAPAAVTAPPPASNPVPSHNVGNVSYGNGSNTHNGGGFGYHGGTGLTGTDFSSLGSAANSAPVPVSGDVKDWIAEAKKILIQMGYPPDAIDEEALAIIIQHESGGNPSIVNGWDSNAAAGHPSIGLMQTIEPTFNSYAVDGHNQIKNPVDNILAASRYAIDRYGSLGNVPGVVAVRHGGDYVGY
ncbi:transglycosylase SLT domain-containing protein [Nocardia pseudobrasiliensis]|uniref:Transglycosylase-like protein with SLT domain n=1 Tax=Nocardia pseudobrasiliensis TaxID=45979 RepID=A0A370I718_9NOCA|nr:transglycosylase SLT domain-containing protein [Nocardia pseudobrasiliensis]RDI66522.1 transglycosylase-like protein with SLT domain [Nocardia pseudobrasiliensis]